MPCHRDQPQVNLRTVDGAARAVMPISAASCRGLAGIEGSNSSHEATAAANQLVERFHRASQSVQPTELMRQWRESSSYQWARSQNERGVEAIESNWRKGEELNQRAERTLQHAEVCRRAAENAQRLVQQGRTVLTTGIAQFAYASGRGAMVETLDPIAQRRNLSALRLKYLGRGGFLADGAFVPSIDALGARTTFLGIDLPPLAFCDGCSPGVRRWCIGVRVGPSVDRRCSARFRRGPRPARISGTATSREPRP